MEDRSPGINMHEFSTADQDFFSNNYSSDISENEILIISVELAEGKSEQLTIHESDNIEMVTLKFCEKFELGPKSRKFLAEEIERNLQLLYPPQLSRLPESIEQEISEPSIIQFTKPNKGEELYMKGVKMRQRVEQKIKLFKEEKEQAEIRSATFKPFTNSPGKRSKPPEQILLEKGRQTTESLQKKRSQQDVKTLSDCTFSPEINKNSGFMKKSQMRGHERYMCLYEDAQNIHEKIMKKKEELIHLSCPFVPNFDLTRKKTKELVKKLEGSQEHREDNYINISPEVNRKKPRAYSPAKKNTFTTEKSDQMIKRLKNHRFREIFQELMPDAKGFINRETVYKSTLDPKIKDIIKPLLQELEAFEERLSLDDFVDAMDVLMRSLNSSEKNLVLKTNKTHNQNKKLNTRAGSSSVLSGRSHIEEIYFSPQKSHKVSILDSWANS